MAVYPNMGTVDAYLRLAVGSFFLALGIKDRRRIRSLLFVAFGASKVAEGVTRFCPLLHLLGTNTLGSPVEAGPWGRSASGYGQWSENPYPTHTGDELLELGDDASADADEAPEEMEGPRRKPSRPLRLVSWRRRSSP